jgi:hypothetical protein
MKTLIPRTTERQPKIAGLIGSPTENENANFVMPARIAGIQVRKDASGDIHVNLDSSTPCWNDAIAGLSVISAISARQKLVQSEKVFSYGNAKNF